MAYVVFRMYGFDSRPLHLICGATQVLHKRRSTTQFSIMSGGTGQLIESSCLTPLSVDGCGRLQLGVANRAASVANNASVDNWPHNTGIVIVSLLGGAWI